MEKYPGPFPPLFGDLAPGILADRTWREPFVMWGSAGNLYIIQYTYYIHVVDKIDIV